jgi:hypothetical protein
MADWVIGQLHDELQAAQSLLSTKHIFDDGSPSSQPMSDLANNDGGSDPRHWIAMKKGRGGCGLLSMEERRRRNFHNVDLNFELLDRIITVNQRNRQ